MSEQTYLYAREKVDGDLIKAIGGQVIQNALVAHAEAMKVSLSAPGSSALLESLARDGAEIVIIVRPYVEVDF